MLTIWQRFKPVDPQIVCKPPITKVDLMNIKTSLIIGGLALLVAVDHPVVQAKQSTAGVRTDDSTFKIGPAYNNPVRAKRTIGQEEGLAAIGRMVESR